MSGPGATVCWWWWQLKILFDFHPENFGEYEPILTHIFQVGWFNHQPGLLMFFFFFSGVRFFSWEANGAQCLFGPKIPSNTRSFFWHFLPFFWWWVVLKGRVGKLETQGRRNSILWTWDSFLRLIWDVKEVGKKHEKNTPTHWGCGIGRSNFWLGLMISSIVDDVRWSDFQFRTSTWTKRRRYSAKKNAPKIMSNISPWIRNNLFPPFGKAPLPTFKISTTVSFRECYCWWFRNPKQPPSVKPFVNNGKNYQPQQVSRISEPSTVPGSSSKSPKVAFSFHRKSVRWSSIPSSLAIFGYHFFAGEFSGMFPKKTQHPSKRVPIKP